MRIPDHRPKPVRVRVSRFASGRADADVLNSRRHGCELGAGTLALLLEHQRARLRGLRVARYLEPQDVSSLLLGGLQQLVLTDLNVEQECEWPFRLIVRNRDSLRDLYLGVVGYCAHHYAMSDRPSQPGPQSPTAKAIAVIFGSELQMVRMSSLETLGWMLEPLSQERSDWRLTSPA